MIKYFPVIVSVFSSKEKDTPADVSFISFLNKLDILDEYQTKILRDLLNCGTVKLTCLTNANTIKIHLDNKQKWKDKYENYFYEVYFSMVLK